MLVFSSGTAKSGNTAHVAACEARRLLGERHRADLKVMSSPAPAGCLSGGSVLPRPRARATAGTEAAAAGVQRRGRGDVERGRVPTHGERAGSAPSMAVPLTVRIAAASSRRERRALHRARAR